MELAINYSVAASFLVQLGKIRVDRFKVPDWPDLIAAARKQLPIYIHFALNAGAADSRTLDWKLADAMARDTNTPYINMHLAPRAKDFGPEGSDPQSRKVIEAMVADVTRAGEFFGPNRVIVENVPLGNPDEGFAPACANPTAIHEIIKRTGAGLLLDLSHARLTARVLGLDERQYISSLPVTHLRELHLTGIQPWEGRMRDHMHMSDQDWIETQWALDHIQRGDWPAPKIIALEYGGVGGTFEWRCDPAKIAEQIPRLYEMVKRIDRISTDY